MEEYCHFILHTLLILDFQSSLSLWISQENADRNVYEEPDELLGGDQGILG
jgi:hypothetical protein